MRFSVALHNAYEGLGYPLGFASDPAMFVRLARTAEALGFDGIWANDHLVTPRFLRGSVEAPRFYEPLITLAHVAAATERIRLGTAVIALPLRDPVSLAKQAVTLDVLSRGRFTLGVGLGAYPDELASTHPDRAARRATAYDESIEALRMLLDRGGGSYHGGTVRFEDVEMSPRTAQAPLPIYVGGHTRDAIERAARWGQGWLPGWRPLTALRDDIAFLHERVVAAGREPAAVEVAPELSASIARRHEDAVRRYESSRLVRHRQSRDGSGRDPRLMAASNLVGGADEIRERVAALAAAGVDHCAALAFPAESVDELIEQWEQFATEVVGPTAG